jgi:hypothetical protein
MLMKLGAIVAMKPSHSGRRVALYTCEMTEREMSS